MNHGSSGSSDMQNLAAKGNIVFCSGRIAKCRRNSRRACRRPRRFGRDPRETRVEAESFLEIARKTRTGTAMPLPRLQRRAAKQSPKKEDKALQRAVPLHDLDAIPARRKRGRNAPQNGTEMQAEPGAAWNIATVWWKRW